MVLVVEAIALFNVLILSIRPIDAAPARTRCDRRISLPSNRSPESVTQEVDVRSFSDNSEYVSADFVT